MCVIRFHVDARVPYGYTAIVVRRRIIDQALCNRTRIMPDHTSRSCVESKSIVRRRHEHQPIYNHGCGFKIAGVRRMKHPLRAQLIDILRRDLGETRVSPP